MPSTMRTSLRAPWPESRRASWVSASASRPANPTDIPRSANSAAINRPMLPEAPSSSTSTVPTTNPSVNESGDQHQEDTPFAIRLDAVANRANVRSSTPPRLASAQKHVRIGARVQPRHDLSGLECQLPKPGTGTSQVRSPKDPLGGGG